MELTKQIEQAKLLIQLNQSGKSFRECSTILKCDPKATLQYLLENDFYFKKCNNPKCENPIKHHSNFPTQTRNLDGHESQCKDCKRRYRKKNKKHIQKRSKEYYQENREKLLADNAEYQRNNRNTRNIYHKQHRKDNPSNYRESDKRYREKNRDKLKQRYEDNRVEILKYWKERNADPEVQKQKQQSGKAYYEQNREIILERMKQYQKDNPDKVRAIRARRRARKKNATVGWTDHKIIDDLYSEANRLEKNDNIPRHVDHIIPIGTQKEDAFVCGLHVHNNLRILTEKENLCRPRKIRSMDDIDE